MFWTVVLKLFITSGVLFLLMIPIEWIFSAEHERYDKLTIIEITMLVCFFKSVGCILLSTGKFIYWLWC